MKIAILALTLVAAANADRTSSANHLRRELENDPTLGDLLAEILFPDREAASIQGSKSAKSSSVGGKSGKSSKEVSCIIHIVYSHPLCASCMIPRH